MGLHYSSNEHTRGRLTSSDCLTSRLGVIPRTAAIERLRIEDPQRYLREERKARFLLFVAATGARDTLRISWHGRPSPFLPVPPEL